MKTDPIRPAALRFESKTTGRRFHALLACFDEKTTGPAWQHQPFQTVGNFIEATWCRGPNADRLNLNQAFLEAPGTGWYRLGTLHYPKDWPTVFGLHVMAGHNPAGDSFGLRFWYAAEGKTVLGSGLGIHFTRKEGDRCVPILLLGDRYRYQAADSDILIVAPGGQEEELAHFTRSAESFRETALARQDALLAEVERRLGQHAVIRWEYGQYEGDGVPPPRFEKALTPAEEDRWRQRARQDLGETRTVIERHYREFHRLLLELLPFERCW